MKKLLIGLLCFSFLLLGIALAEGNETNETNTTIIEEVIIPEPVKKITTYEGSFYLANGKSLFGIKSNYDGMGFGSVVGMWSGQIKFPIYSLNLRSVNIYALRPMPFQAVHFKKIAPQKYSGYETYESYEVLSSLRKDDIFYNELIIRTPVKNPVFIVESEKGIEYNRGKQVYQDQRYTTPYYKVKTDQLGLITVAEEKVEVVEYTIKI